MGTGYIGLDGRAWMCEFVPMVAMGGSASESPGATHDIDTGRDTGLGDSGSLGNNVRA